MATSAISQLSIPLPRSPDARIYIRLWTQAKAIMLSLTTAVHDQATAPRPMGSFVYALPDHLDPRHALSTPLFSDEPTLDFSTRLAKVIARRAQLPVYVTNSMSLADASGGNTAEEEVEALQAIADVVLARLPSTGLGPAGVNGEAAG